MGHKYGSVKAMMGLQTESRYRAEPKPFENCLPRPNVIIGLGNEIAGDDGAGIWVARKLGEILQDRPEIEVVPLPWAGFSLLDMLVGRQRAAIVDCLCTGLHPPGTIVRLNEKDFRGSVRLNSFHDINFATVLELGRKMGWQMPAQIAIWGIEGDEMDEFKEELSPAVWRAVDQVVKEILRFFNLKSRLYKNKKFDQRITDKPNPLAAFIRW
jgi:hydrogenase maturation protease